MNDMIYIGRTRRRDKEPDRRQSKGRIKHAEEEASSPLLTDISGIARMGVREWIIWIKDRIALSSSD